MFLAGIKRGDRQRGSGWLDCRNCHEHAQHDVVDDMRFASAPGFTTWPSVHHFPAFRIRRLVCRRCDFQQPPRVTVPTALDRAESAIAIAAALDWLVLILRLFLTLFDAVTLGFFLPMWLIGMAVAGYMDRGTRLLRPVAWAWVGIRLVMQLIVVVVEYQSGAGVVATAAMALLWGIPLLTAIKLLSSPSVTEYIGQMAGRPRVPPADQMEKLETSGQPIRRAWLLPTGIIGQAITYACCVAVVGVSGTTLGGKSITLVPHTGQRVIPALSIDVPSDWNFEADSQGPNQCAQYPCVISSEVSSLNSIIVERDPLHTDLTSLELVHFADQQNFQSQGYPAAPPAGSCTTVAGVPAYKYVMDWQLQGSPVRSINYVLVHDHVGYVVIFIASGSETINTLGPFAERVVQTIKFSGNDTGPTPQGVSTASPSPLPSVSPSASGEPSATPSLAPGSFQSPAATPGGVLTAPIHCGGS